MSIRSFIWQKPISTAVLKWTPIITTTGNTSTIENQSNLYNRSKKLPNNIKTEDPSLKWISKSFIWSVNCSFEWPGLDFQTLESNAFDDYLIIKFDKKHSNAVLCIATRLVRKSSLLLASYNNFVYAFSYSTAMYTSKDKEQVCWTESKHYKDVSYAVHGR